MSLKGIKYQWAVYLLISKIWIKHILLGREAKWQRYFWERLGKLSPEIKQIIGEKCIWLQAASEGDVISLDNFLRKLKEELPDYKIIFSTQNFGLFEILKKFKAVDAMFYFPWDTTFFCRRVLKLIRPQIFIMIEVAYYPMFLRQAKIMGVPVRLLSGFYRQKEMENLSLDTCRSLVGLDVFRHVNFLGMQTPLDAENVISLGADKNRVKVTGSLKMDLDYALLDESEKKSLREEFNISFDDIVIVAGPTHHEGDKLILEAYKDILLEFAGAVLILVPRYIQDITRLENIIDNLKFSSIRRSRLKDSPRSKEVIIVDTFGELPKLYGLATIVILGASFFPPGGGHNILEQAVHQKPIFFGPYMHNRVEFLGKLKSAWEGLEVKDKGELVKNIVYLLKHPDKLKEVGFALSGILQDKEELISGNVELIKEMLKTE